MGTRNLSLLKKDGKFVVAQYGQWDGYPEGQGATILNFCRDEAKMQKLIELLPRVRFFTKEELENLNKVLQKVPGYFVSAPRGWKIKYPQLTRDTGGEIFDVILNLGKDEGEILLEDECAFALYGLYCEWAYCINLDTNKFEVYKGFSREPLTPNDEFYCDGFSDGCYYPVKKIREFDMDNLPDENAFVAAFENAE